MNDEEVEALYLSLSSYLSELTGEIDLYSSSTRGEDDAELNIRERLSRVLDRYEQILVDAPIMLGFTMRSLEAESISFAADPANYNSSFFIETAQPEAQREVTVTLETVTAWMSLAEDASKQIAAIRKILS